MKGPPRHGLVMLMRGQAREQSDDSASVARSLGFAATEKIVRAVITFGVGVVVLRHLGPVENARLVNAVATATLLATIGKLGLDNVAMREIADRPAESSNVTWRFVPLRFSASALLAWTLFHFSAAILPGSSVTLVSIVALSAVIQGSDLGLVWCQGLKLLQFTSIVSIGIAMTSAVTKIALVIVGAHYVAFVGLTVLEFVAAAVILNFKGFAVSKRRPRSSPRTQPLTGAGEVGYAMATSLVIVCFFSFDAIVLPRIVPLDVAGRYLAAKSLSDGATTIGASFSVALFPFLVAARNESREQLAKVFDASLSVAAFLGVTIGCALVLGYTLIIGRWLGGRFAGTGPALAILAVGVGLFLQGGVVDSHLTIARRMGFIFNKGLAALLLKAAVIFALRSELTPTSIAIITIVCSYGATLLVTYLVVPEVFLAQVKSLNPMRLVPSVKVILALR